MLACGLVWRDARALYFVALWALLPCWSHYLVSKVDNSSHNEFYDYYRRESESEATLARFARIRDTVLKAIDLHDPVQVASPLDVADIGCGAGSQCRIWATAGHRVHGLDINEPLLQLARERANVDGMNIEYRLGSATDLPWGDGTMDICLVPELLEHVVDWQQCLDEFARVLRPGGVLFLSTTNALCPVQDEFNLPLYSWYPARLKRRMEALAKSSKPSLANYAKYPAINWFTYGSLSSELHHRGIQTFDRFDFMDSRRLSSAKQMVLWMLRRVPAFRTLTQLFIASTMVVGVKRR